MALRGVLAACSLGIPALAGAQAAGPSIDHTPVTSVPAGKPVDIRAVITSNSTKQVFNPSLYFRPAGVKTFSRVSLEHVKGVPDLYSAILPAESVSAGFDYYLEAYDEDGNGPSRIGSETAPFSVKVAQPAEVSTAAPSTIPTSTSTSAAKVGGAHSTIDAAATGGSVSTSAQPSHTGAWVSLGTAAALLVGAAVVTKVTQTTYESAKSDYRAGRTGTPNQSALGWQGPLADVLWGGAAVAAGVGAYLYFSPAPDNGSGGEVGLVGHF